MPNPVKSLAYVSSATAQVAPDLSKALVILSDTFAVDQEDLKPYWKSQEKATFLLVINNPIIYKFFKNFTNHKKKTNGVVVFSCRPFPNILTQQLPMKPSNNLENKTPSDTY